MDKHVFLALTRSSFFLGPFKNKRNSDPSGGNFNRKIYHLIVLLRCFSFLLRKTEKKGLKTKPHKDTKGDEIISNKIP